jgi:uncharacterized membrane protein
MTLAATVIWVLLVASAIPLIWLSRAVADGVLNRTAVGALWASFVWLLSGTAFAPAIGPHYSSLRLALINLNITVVLAGGAFLFFKGGAKLPAALSSCWIAMGWLYLRAVSFSL